MTSSTAEAPGVAAPKADAVGVGSSDADRPSAEPSAIAAPQSGRRRALMWLWGLAALCVIVVLGALVVGRFVIPLNEVARILLGQVLPLRETWYPQEKSVVLDVRLPRVLLALLVGMGLSLTGAAMQAVFQNPLASAQMLGVSAGASFGGVLTMLFGFGSVVLVTGSFFGGLAALVLVLLISRAARGASLLVIILAGLVVGAMFNAFVSFITYIADPYDTLPSIVFWLMGSMASADYSRVLIALIPIVIGGLVITVLRWRLNILALGDEDALALGMDPARTRTVLLAMVALITAGAVAVGGVIGWVGLVVPHLARMLLGTSDNRYIIPASALLGGSYLITIDTLSRTISATELPIGILTAVIGAPFFIALLLRNRQIIWGGGER